MLRITGHIKNLGGVAITVDDGKDPRLHILRTGILEQYMGAYGLEAGETLTLLLADGHLDGIDAPPIGDPEATTKNKAAIKKANGLIKWDIDRDQVLADVTMAEDTAEMVRSTWAETVKQTPEPELTAEEQLRKQFERKKATVEGHKRLREERLADDIVSSMPAHLRRQPRTPESAKRADVPVGLAIQFVP